jgi:hypothetical protein
MAISSISSNYVNRSKDISILQYPDASLTDAQAVFPQFGANARFCTGVQKLVQKYAITLLTNITSQPNFPDFGTNFLYTLQAGISPVDRMRATQIFVLASFKAVTALRKYQVDNPSIPDDEKIVRAELVSLDLYGGYVGFSVNIVTAAGENVPFVIPLPK